MSRSWLIALFCVFLAAISFATTLERGVASDLKNYNPPFSKEIYRLRITNSIGGSIEVSNDGGYAWQILGHVIYPTTKVNQNGFAAAMWVEAGRVAATAVNAIHIKTGIVDKDKTVFSILPKEMLQAPSAYRSFYSSNSSIYTDISGGTGIFGGGQSPYVGNQVFLSRDKQSLIDLPEKYTPKIGDIINIVVERPVPLPKAMVFENRFGGRITLENIDGTSKIIGEVLRPVSGVGRFEGGVFASPGRIRANHPGVIDVSLAPRGSVGGFQIVPALHGQSLDYVREKGQWLVIGPESATDPSLEGIGPFFKYYLQPNYSADALQRSDWQEKLLDRYLVQVKYGENDRWRPAPIFSMDRNFPLPAWADTALEKVTHIRILFPLE